MLAAAIMLAAANSNNCQAASLSAMLLLRWVISLLIWLTVPANIFVYDKLICTPMVRDALHCTQQGPSAKLASSCSTCGRDKVAVLLQVTTVWVLYNVYVAFEDPEAAIKAQKALHRRIFGNNKIDASYYNEAWMEQKLFF